ncbi:M20 family metallo-hydrolase [Halomonas sp. BC04]|uniref:M20 family metallo-hydrolase n=1 Tax=Halomonas sp. BC04 TaxID=1403540 RepID=UPI0003ED874F|nr:M20 family metallo-hydrolase [Halomonas sp. BC04]EWG98768.1 allantoate amidohydrolase [Halomonas sp. BC04]
MTLSRSADDLGRRLMERLDEAAAYSMPGQGVTRLFAGDEHRRLLPLLSSWMRLAGLEPELDAVGNLVGRCPRALAGEPVLILGSHQDSVIEGGKYDGMLGVAMPLLALEALREQGCEISCAVEVVAFGDEEGVRFPSTLVGSRALAGTLDPKVLEGEDKEGVTLREALARLGADTSRLAEVRHDPERVLGYVEVHIEQGPVLENEGLALGVVTALTGIERHRLKVSGKAGHAGTTPMEGRRDALVGASAMVLEADSLLRRQDSLVGVVGQLFVRPGAVNVIPSEVEFTLELRSPDSEERLAGRRKILASLAGIAKERGLELMTSMNYEAEGVTCADWLVRALEQACREEGQPTRRLFSGAGHDGLAMNDLTDIGMLFLRCKGGLSHHPDEAILAEDAGAGTRVIMHLLTKLHDMPRTDRWMRPSP